MLTLAPTCICLLLTGGSIREQGPEFFLKEEIAEARRSVKQLDEAVTKATSFREKSSHLLEDANRALSRLEQVGMGLGLGGGRLEHVGLGLRRVGRCFEHIGMGFTMGRGCLQGAGRRRMTTGL